MTDVPFNQPHATGREDALVAEAIANGHLSANGPLTRRCTDRLEALTGTRRALLTHSCTGALEMAALLLGVGAGDEVIMPSFTFVSTANAFVLRGAVPVFVDIRPDTLNLDEARIEAAVTLGTRAIVPVHYAGVACEMDAILAIARHHGLAVVEDAAHALTATYRGRTLGSIGELGTLSFHETKNVISGEGGALLVNDPGLVERAEIVHDKGTNRRRFLRGEVDKYTWEDVGSSFPPSEITAAFLLAQLEAAGTIIARRMAIWERYHEAFAELETAGLVRRPFVPADCRHDAHMYYLLLADEPTRDAFIGRLADRGVDAVFHYVPLHSSPAGRRHGRAHGRLRETESASGRLVRLPLWIDMSSEQLDHVISAVHGILRDMARAGGGADRAGALTVRPAPT